MADINQVITLGIGTPADISHFILVGLSTGTTPPVTAQPGVIRVRGIYEPTIAVAGVYQPTIAIRGLAED